MNKDLIRFTALADAAMLFIAMYPQVSLWFAQGKERRGSYAVSNYDETAYSAYVNGLMNGDPRKSDPLVKFDEPPQPETLYSIQFIPAYFIAIPARVFGVSVSTAFIFLIAFLAIATVAALSFLFNDVTGDALFSAAGVVVVLCFGTAAALQGELRQLLEGRVVVDFLPFLRRYQPGIALPLFFIFAVCVRRAVGLGSTRQTVGYAVVAGAIFATLVFSYFYLWTAAAAWLACFAVITVTVASEARKRVVLLLGIVGAFAATALVPYFYLLSLRAVNLDSVQLLTFTRVPDLTSPSMWIGLVVAGIAVFRGSKGDHRLSAIILSLALTPVILFNQQVVTGRSLQPIHYEIFFANYIVLAAAMLLLWTFVRDGSAERSRRVFAYLGIAAFLWGCFEAHGSTSRNRIAAEIRDNSVPAIEYAAEPDPEHAVIHATNFVTADFVASASNARSLWNAHTSSAGGVDIAENKRLFYLYLYYSGFKPKDLDEALKQNSFETVSAIFGSERALPALAANGGGISSEEIQTETKKFADFVEGFDAAEAAKPVLTAIIVPTEIETDLTNLDRWYQRDEGRKFGMFTVYKLTPKPAVP